MTGKLMRIVACAVAVLTALSSAGAQKTLVAGIGAGTRVGSRESTNGAAGSLHGLAFAEAHLPIVPVGVRLDAMFLDAGRGGGPVALSVSGVFVVPIPAVQPYVMAGWGRYGVGRDSSTNGWNVGVGARVTTGPFHVFAEVRRHHQLKRDLFTLGLTL